LHKILMRGARLDGNDAALQVTAGTGTTINILHPGAVPPPPPGKHDLQGTAIPVDPEVLALNHDLDTPVNVASAPTAATSEHRAALPTVKRRAGRPRTATLAATPAPDPAASTNSPPPALVPPVIRIG
jgi:hypothetical protein